MISPPKRRHAPRQLSTEREQELLDVACDLFLTQGIYATSMNEIAKCAKVSKTTIYRRFDSKSQMFEMLIRNSVKRLNEQLDKIVFDESRPVESLRETAKLIMQATTLPEHVNLLRQLIAEVPRNPTLRQLVTTGWYSYIPNNLVVFFTHLINNGLMNHPSPLLAARTFILLCNGGYDSLLDAECSKKTIETHLDMDIEIFLIGCKIRNIK